MNRLFFMFIAALLAAGLQTTRAQQNNGQGEKLLASAQHKATVDGDLKGAIDEYKKIVAGAGANRTLAAQALVRMAECYQKLGDGESRKIYERIVREFGDQKEAAAQARTRLAALQSPTPVPASQTARLVWTGQEAFGAVRGSPSPDGRYLTFLQIGALAVRDLKDGTSRILASESGATLWYTAFSPDGRQVAYGWLKPTGRDITGDLRIVSVTGDDATPRVIYRNAEITQIRPFGWTPDGKHVLVLRSLRDGTNQIAMVSVQDGSIRVLKSLAWNYTAMSLSPDGRYIAYDALSGNNTSASEIYVLAADGSREVEVVQGPASNGFPLWSPDGARLLFLSDRTGDTSLWAVPIEQGKPNGPAELMKADIGRVRLQGITRNGTLYYLAAGVLRSNIYTAELDAAMKATGPPVVATDRFINSNSAPTWSPDGRSLAYLSSRRRGTGSTGATVLVIRTVTTGEERDIPLPREVLTGNLANAPRWFPDGRSLLVFGFLAKSAGLFYGVDVASGKAEVVREAKGVSGNAGLGASAISPDGKTIFYIASATDPFIGQTNLIRFEIDSHRETVLKSGAGNSLALSPDGTQLVLHTYDGTPGGCHLEVMPASGGEVREVVRTGNCNPSRLSWSPNNDLLFVRGGNSTPNVLWRVPAAGGEPEQIGISMPGQIDHPQVHPDGHRITFAVFDTGASEEWTLEGFLPPRSTKK
jgi:Tol biopolymer transport system component